jgi:hypothetical protein
VVELKIKLKQKCGEILTCVLRKLAGSEQKQTLTDTETLPKALECWCECENSAGSSEELRWNAGWMKGCGLGLHLQTRFQADSVTKTQI